MASPEFTTTKTEQWKQFVAENILPAKSWKPEQAEQIFEELESPSWAPWLAASIETLAGRTVVFPAGQLCLCLPGTLKSTGKEFIAATLSTNRITWDGEPETLPSWDDVAGEPTTYENTYIPNGNTLVLMSMNVHVSCRGVGLAGKMIDEIKQVASNLGVDNLIGSFRPSGFGAYKAETGEWWKDFSEYCFMTREDGLPVDGWLRSLTRKGMEPIKIDEKAMVITIPLETFEIWKKAWQHVSPEVWECGEVGQWTVDKIAGIAIYQESNLWGRLPIG